MRRGGGPTRLGMIVIAIVAVAAIGGLVFWVGGRFFGSGKTTNNTVSAAQKLLDSPTENTVVQMKVRGPITAKENHYDVALSISAKTRKLFITTDYGAKIETDETLPNSTASFKDLTAALSRAGFMAKANDDVSTDGICATGQLIKFSVLDGDKTAEELWSISCADGGSFAGKSGAVLSLLLQQIPDAQDKINYVKGNSFSASNPLQL